LGIFRDPSHGKAIQDDPRIGLSTLPEWLPEVVRDLLKRSSDASQTPNQASAAEGMPYQGSEVMTDGFKTVLSASEKDCRDLFVSARGRIGSVEQNIEKDFWVCWILDALLNGLQRDHR